VFPDPALAPSSARLEPRAIPPALDPLSPRNAELPLPLRGEVLRSLGVDLTRPSLVRTGRLDRWSDPHTALDWFALAREQLPELQLVIAGALPGEGGDDFRIAREIEDYAANRPDVHLITGYLGVGNVELNALQSVGRAAVQTSLRDGSAAPLLEAMWKRTPVLSGPAGGELVGIGEGAGYVCEDAAEAAAHLVEIVRDPGFAFELGGAGRERVRERFLVTRALGDELDLLAGVPSSGPATVKR
jgi:trehalose synthase